MNSFNGLTLLILLNDKSIFLILGTKIFLIGVISFILLLLRFNINKLGAFQLFISSMDFILFPLKSNSSKSGKIENINPNSRFPNFLPCKTSFFSFPDKLSLNLELSTFRYFFSNINNLWFNLFNV